MKLNRIWGYGQLFGFSAFEGPNRYYDDFILMTMKRRLEWRIEYRDHFVTVSFPLKGKIKIETLMSDFAIAETASGVFKIAFQDNDTLVGVSPVPPYLKGERKLSRSLCKGVEVFRIDHHFLGVKCKMEDGLYKFVIHNSFSEYEAASGANYYFEHADVGERIQKFEKYYLDLPKCKDKKYEALYYKALSVNKVNTHSPEGQIGRFWSTPDRVPHRHMWMWDSAFHATAIATYNGPAAEEMLLAMLETMKLDGFIPHMANPTDCTDITQPCVMSWATYQVYKHTKNKIFLQKCLYFLEKYLNYDLIYRDENKNGLLEWKTDPDDLNCKCGESGLDNSPRFDFDQKMDCLDFSSYLALDSNYLSLLYKEIGDEENYKKWKLIYERTASQINSLLWDEKDGYYCDRLFDGTLTKVLTHSTFLPMFASIASKEQASRLVNLLSEDSLLWSPFPLSSISRDHPEYSNDMWRGGVWLNLNYFVIQGLRNYGYYDLAKKLRDITLEKVNKWYCKTGCIFEFYDPEDLVSPFYCHRKGEPLKNPDYRKHVHSISDYNWSASFILLMIGDYYE